MKKECKDCKHIIFYKHANFAVEFAKCGNPKVTSDYKYCSTQRLGSWLFSIVANSCGKRGRYWEKK